MLNFKRLGAIFVAVFFSLMSSLALAALDVNQATVAELDGIKGIGPATSARIMEARQAGPFKDWPDLMMRVKGIGQKSAAKLSTNGLTVNGTSFDGAASPAKPAAVKKAKAAVE